MSLILNKLRPLTFNIKLYRHLAKYSTGDKNNNIFEAAFEKLDSHPVDTEKEYPKVNSTFTHDTVSNNNIFEQHFEKLDNYPIDAPKLTVAQKPQTFAALLKNSKFVDLGDPENKVVYGKIFHVVDDDLYIDFGWKFHCVCPRPKKNGELYVRGSRVRLLIKDLELSSKFLGYEKDLTLLEADCVLLGLQQDSASATNAARIN